MLKIAYNIKYADTQSVGLHKQTPHKPIYLSCFNFFFIFFHFFFVVVCSILSLLVWLCVCVCVYVTKPQNVENTSLFIAM